MRSRHPAGEGEVSYKILLIDHDESLVERIQRPLADAGYEVVVATCAEEGVQTLEKLQPDLAVIEALLPEKSGPELCREIKNGTLGKSMPVILMLEEDEEAQARAKEMDLHSCDMLINRSIQESELLELCQRIIAEQDAQAEAAGQPVADKEEPEADNQATPTDLLLDTYELDSALQRLDTIIAEESPAEESPEGHEAAEQAGDFSHIAEELGSMQPGGKQSEEERTPPTETPKAPIKYSRIAEELGGIRADDGERSQSRVQELQQLADTDGDIDSKLDSVLAMDGPSEAAPRQAEAPVATYEEIDAKSAPEKEVPAPNKAQADAVKRDEPAAKKQEAEKPLDELFKEQLATPKSKPEPAVYPTRSPSFPAPMPETEPGRGFLKKYWWVAAALLAVTLAGTGVLMMRGEPQAETVAANLTSETGAPPAEQGGTVGAAAMASSPSPPAMTEGEETDILPAEAEPEAVDQAAPKPKPEPVAAKPKPAPKPAPVAQKPKPKPEPVRQTPVATKPKPKPAAQKPKPKPQPVKTAPVVTKPEPKPKPAEAPPAATKPEPKPVPKPATRSTPAAAKPEPKPEPEVVKVAPAPVEVEKPPAEPVFEPPVVLERVDPVYSKKALKKASGGTIILKLLISENGKIIRVKVDQGAPVPDLEAAAMSAVLRWKFNPATEDGVPVEAWTTAEFSY
jgi:TonB family protein